MNHATTDFGTTDKDEILLLMVAALLRRFAQPAGRLSDGKRVAIEQSLHWLTATCGLATLGHSAIERIAADASRDARVVDHALVFICGNTPLASKVLIESFRVAVSGSTVAAVTLERLISFAAQSEIRKPDFHRVYFRYCYDVFSDASVTDALRSLEVSRHAELEDIKRSYRELSKRFHPDRHSGLSDGAKRDFAARFIEVTKANERLTAILEAGQWCRKNGHSSLIAAAHELVVDCFFCESQIRLPHARGVLASARCPVCKSLAVFPKDPAEDFLQLFATRENRPPRDWPKPEPKPPSDPGPKGRLRSHSPVFLLQIFATVAVVLVLGLATCRLELSDERTLPPSERTAPPDTAADQRNPPFPPEPTESPPQPRPKTLPRAQSREELLESGYSQASTLADTGRLTEALNVLRSALSNITTPEGGHLEVWVKCQSLLRSVLLRVSADKSVLSASALSLRREAVEVCHALMTQYGRHGEATKARSEFELATNEIASLLATVSRGVRDRLTRVNKYLDLETARLLQTKSQLYWDYGQLTRDSEVLETSVAVAGQVVDFCEEAFGKDSETTVVARRHLRWKEDRHSPGR